MDNILSFFKYISQSNLINFILMVWILCWVCSKFNLKSGLDNAVSKVEEEINVSDTKKNEAYDSLCAAKISFENLPSEIENLKNESTNKADILKKRFYANSNEQISKLRSSISSVILAQENTISSSLIDKTVLFSVSDAKQNIKNMVKLDKNLHKYFIDESLKELDEVKL